MTDAYIRLLVLILALTSLLFAQPFRQKIISAGSRIRPEGLDGVLFSGITDVGKGSVAKKSGFSALPPIDTRKYENIQTATFALG